MNRTNYYYLFALLSCPLTPVSAWQWDTPGGHVKYQYQSTRHSDHSVFRPLVGTGSSDQLLDNRWKFTLRQNAWDFQADYQLQAVQGDRRRLAAVSDIAAEAVPDDDARLLDLTHILSEDNDTTLLHRFDRFNLGYTADNAVLRFGRQVVSWGNGLLFNPLDFFNPFDPAALDTEYKTGDDMLYGQYLLTSGADIQGVWVIRRDPAGGATQGDQSSIAAKYHTGLESAAELDILLAEHHGDEIAGLGLIKSLGGAVWRSDLMFTRGDGDSYWSFITNLSYSWVWRDTNWSGAVEYYYNGLGLPGDAYTVTDIQAKPDLFQRLLRGELYTFGKQYIAATATIELSPLWLATPAVLANLRDQSALLQLSSQYSLAQSWQLTAAVNIPLGSKNTEYGGIKTGVGETTLATEGGVFLQLGFYY